MRSYLLLLTLISLGCETSPATGAVEGEVCATAAECASELRCVANLCVPASALICPEEVVEFAPKTLHRLNRIEYDNAVRDLLGVEVAPARDFPADDHGHGFDNIADVLTIAPLLLEKWEAAATWVVDEALRALPEARWRVEAGAPRWADASTAAVEIASKLADRGVPAERLQAAARRLPGGAAGTRTLVRVPDLTAVPGFEAPGGRGAAPVADPPPADAPHADPPPVVEPPPDEEHE